VVAAGTFSFFLEGVVVTSLWNDFAEPVAKKLIGGVPGEELTNEARIFQMH